MQVVVLAGGLASRMRPLSRELPKSLFPVAGRPFVDHQLALLAKGGATQVLFCIGHLGHLIRAHLEKNPAPIPVEFVEDGPIPAGTGGALGAALKAGRLAERFLVTYGDSYLPIDLRPLIEGHQVAGTPATMSVLNNHGQWDQSNCVVFEGRVTRYEKIAEAARRPAEVQWIDYGVSALERTFVEQWLDAVPFELNAPLSRLAQQGDLAAFEVTERFYEIGSPSGLADLERLLARPQRTGGSP
jgi:NDP-sugar pyrophosphorylase family protein